MEMQLGNGASKSQVVIYERADTRLLLVVTSVLEDPGETCAHLSVGGEYWPFIGQWSLYSRLIGQVNDYVGQLCSALTATRRSEFR